MVIYLINKPMQLRHTAVDEMYDYIVMYGLKTMIDEGIKVGSLQSVQEGVHYVKEMITAYEVLEHYEKCQVLHDDLKGLYEIKAAA
jgi:hypothetical protein